MEKALNESYREAQIRNHAYLTLEHLLYSILHTPEGKKILVNVGVNIDELRKDIEEYLDSLETSPKGQNDPIQSISFQRILQKALVHLHSSEKTELEIGDVLVAILDEEDSFARYFLEKQEVSKLTVLEYITHGVSRSIHAEEDEGRKKGTASGLKNQGVEKMLEKFTVNMTQKATEGKYDPTIGREKELMRTIEILSRKQKNNPIHVGDPGVGKTAITQGLAQKIVDGDVPDKLQNYEIFSIDMGTMLAGTKFRGDFEERIKNVFKAIQLHGKAIVYIDEIHSIVGSGSVSGGTLDAANLLKPLISNGEIRVIGSTTYEEYRSHFERDRALARRFQKIDINEPDREDTLQIIKGLQSKYESFHKIRYTPAAVHAAVDLSIKYLRDRRLPDKAIDMLDEAGAFVSVYHTNRKSVSVIDMENLIARVVKIPAENVSLREKESLQHLAEKLNTTVYGQEKAIESIVSAVKRHRAGLSNPDKPIGSFLFIGPTGVGKTELSRQLAFALGVELIRFDMSEYMEKHTISQLLGSPPGYVGYNEGALLTDSIRKNPHAVLLLDEIEKAHPDIFNALLQVMDHATITDTTGKKADFRNVVLIMTSNAGSRELSANKIGFAGDFLPDKNPGKEVKNFFSPEFRNRLDEIVVFGHLDKPIIVKIVHKQISTLREQLSEKKINIELEASAETYLAENGYDPMLGARPMARLIQNEVKNPIVEEILFGKLSTGGEVIISAEDEKLSFKFLGNPMASTSAKKKSGKGKKKEQIKANENT